MNDLTWKDYARLGLLCAAAWVCGLALGRADAWQAQTLGAGLAFVAVVGTAGLLSLALSPVVVREAESRVGRRAVAMARQLMEKSKWQTGK